MTCPHKSFIGFGITRLLDFDLLPRIKQINRDLQREINAGLNVVENYNGVQDYIHFGKSGELASNRREEQELSMLCLQILQSSLGFVNTLMIQDTLAEPEWADAADSRGTAAGRPRRQRVLLPSAQGRHG